MNNNKKDKEYLSVLLCKERRRFYMRYVFFDIECADGGKGSICSFGYVICDEEFREIESDDIIINPDSAYKLRNVLHVHADHILISHDCFVFGRFCVS